MFFLGTTVIMSLIMFGLMVHRRNVAGQRLFPKDRQIFSCDV
jgi:hypothetical protein